MYALVDHAKYGTCRNSSQPIVYEKRNVNPILPNLSVFERPFVKRLARSYRLSYRCLSVCPVWSVCNVGVLWPNGWMGQDEAWHGQRPPPRPHCVRWGPSPQFSAHVCCGLTAGWIKMPLGTEVGLGLGHIVLDEDSAPPTKGHSTPTFRPMSIVARRLDGPRCHFVRG